MNYSKYGSSWHSSAASAYLNSFSLNDINTLIINVNTLNPQTCSQLEIDNVMKDVCDICIKPAIKVGMCKECRRIARRSVTHKDKPWFDVQCKKKRTEYLKQKAKLKNDRSLLAKQETIAKCTAYKKHIKATQKLYNTKLHKNLRNLRGSNPKEYWNIIKGPMKNTNTEHVSLLIKSL